VHPCTACKRNCPDIDLEHGYWKELDLPARRVAYFAWPGLVVGYFVAPRLPVPGALVLALTAAASYALLAVVERRVRAAVRGDDARAAVRHRAFSLAGFGGFVLFYALTALQLPAAAAIALVAVAAVTATLVLARRWPRREQRYVEEKLARGVLARWSSDFGEAPPPGSLGDVYLIASERQKEREARTAAYKDTLHEMIADGLLSRNELALMGKLRAQLGISDREHERAVEELSLEDRRLFDPAYQGSLERRLMLEQLAEDLERLVLVTGKPIRTRSRSCASSAGSPATTGKLRSRPCAHRAERSPVARPRPRAPSRPCSAPRAGPPRWTRPRAPWATSSRSAAGAPPRSALEPPHPAPGDDQPALLELANDPRSTCAPAPSMSSPASTIPTRAPPPRHATTDGAALVPRDGRPRPRRSRPPRAGAGRARHGRRRRARRPRRHPRPEQTRAASPPSTATPRSPPSPRSRP
jgi:hypothetical protein